MNTIYKIHPAIGVCRIGDSAAWFIGPEKEGSKGVDIQANGQETEVTNFKVNGEIKRQGARFKVWEYKVDNGVEIPVKELDSSTFIEWRVKVANTKASGNQIIPIMDQEHERRVLAPNGNPRNSQVANRSSLEIVSDEVLVSGANSAPAPLDQGTFLGKSVNLGDVMTDSNANLIVLGGTGDSEGIPEVSGGPIPMLESYANNDRWHDDVSDGYVKATIHIAGQTSVEAVSAWVVCGPPDMAPGVKAPTTLHDFALAAATKRNWRTIPSVPSFSKDILPILKRSLSMRWVHDWAYWSGITDDWAMLSNLNEDDLRSSAYDAVIDADLRRYAVTTDMKDVLTKWKDGIFIDDYANPPSETDPKILDRVAMESCIATSFFPGIDAGYTITDPAIYSEQGRLSPQAVRPGFVTRQMALPWQADWNDCRSDWWPSQRPNDVYRNDGDVSNNGSVEWSRGVGGRGDPVTRQDMVDNFAKLGLIYESNSGNKLEQERDQSLPV